MNTDPFLSLLQFADGLFPAGSHAHSGGLETFTAMGLIVDAGGVEEFLRSSLEWSIAPCDGVAAAACLGAAAAGDLAACLEIDLRLDATKPAREAREASRQMGRQVLRVARGMEAHPVLSAFAEEAASGETPGHHAAAFGVAGAAFGWPALEMISAYLHSSAAATVGAALRLLPIGQMAGQRILANLRPLLVRLAREASERPRDAMWGFAPSLEFAAMAHASLDARLFRS